MRWEEGESLWPCPSGQRVSELPTTLSPDSGSVSGILVPQVHCGWWWGTVFGSWTSRKSKQPNIPQFLTVGTAVWAMQIALSLGRESLEHGIDQPSPTPFPSRPWQGLFLGLAPGCLLTRSGRLSASALLHRPGRLAACQGQAHVSSRLPGEGRRQSLQRGL